MYVSMTHGDIFIIIIKNDKILIFEIFGVIIFNNLQNRNISLRHLCTYFIVCLDEDSEDEGQESSFLLLPEGALEVENPTILTNR